MDTGQLVPIFKTSVVQASRQLRLCPQRGKQVKWANDEVMNPVKTKQIGGYLRISLLCFLIAFYEGITSRNHQFKGTNIVATQRLRILPK